MPFSGSGSFAPYTPGNPVVSGAVISATDHNNTISDIASGLSNTVTRDGQSPPTANLPMGNFKLTGLAAGTVAGDSVRYEQIQALDAVASINGSCISGFRNVVINGNFGINQRGVSGSVVLAAGGYGHDRWKAGAGGCTYTFATSLNVTTLTITAGTLMQVVEGLNLQSGTYKLSFSGTATARIDAGAYGASGASVTGTAVGGTNQTVEFGTGTVSKVQYEYGTVATLLEKRPYSLELALCQRYLPAWTAASGQSIGAVGMCYAATSAEFVLTYQVQPRVAPTGITATSNRFGALTAAGTISAASTPSINGSASSVQGLSILLAGTSGLVAGNGTILYCTGGTGTILATGCEL